MILKGEFGVLDFEAYYTWSRDIAMCPGNFKFYRESCITCPFREECELTTVAEYGLAGRPNTWLKEYLFIAPYTYKYLPPLHPKRLIRHLESFASTRVLRLTLRQQIYVVYKMFLRQAFLRAWKVKSYVDRDGARKYISRINMPYELYFEPVTKDQLLRVTLGLQSLMYRLSVKVQALVTIEHSGWLGFVMRQFTFQKCKWYWVPLLNESADVIQSMLNLFSDYRDHFDELMENKVESLPQVKVPTIVVAEITNQIDPIIKWVNRHMWFIRVLAVFTDSFRVIKALQVHYVPLVVVKINEGVLRFPYIACFRIPQSPSRDRVNYIRKEALEEVLSYGDLS